MSSSAQKGHALFRMRSKAQAQQEALDCAGKITRHKHQGWREGDVHPPRQLGADEMTKVKDPRVRKLTAKVTRFHPPVSPELLRSIEAMLSPPRPDSRVSSRGVLQCARPIASDFLVSEIAPFTHRFEPILIAFSANIEPL